MKNYSVVTSREMHFRSIMAIKHLLITLHRLFLIKLRKEPYVEIKRVAGRITVDYIKK